MFKLIIKELKRHAPFTLLGALSGIVLMVILKNISQTVSYRMFYIFHPLHVLLSALATAGMYRNYKCRLDRKKCNPFLLLFVGYIGSIGIATLSDSLIPHAGEVLIGMEHSHAHIGFIEQWWLVNPLAIAGIAIAYYKAATRFPHFAHVLVSTWASIFHILMAKGGALNPVLYVPVFLFLFIAVWVPCCVSDIVFPLLFVGREEIEKYHSH